MNISWRKANQKNAKMKKPTNKKDLESFLGLINFYRRYLPRYSELIEPFVEMRKKGRIYMQNKAFDTLKKALTSEPVIKIFEPNKEVILTIDASEGAIAAVVSQEGHPIMYLSRKFLSAECNYSNIEKEALAIVWNMERAQKFLLGKKLFLKSDHKPLEFLFSPRKELQSNIVKNFKGEGLSKSERLVLTSYVLRETPSHMWMHYPG